MSFSLKTEIKNSILVGIIGVLMAGCMAKDAPQLSYYELGYDENKASQICDRRADLMINLAFIRAQDGYKSRDIITKDGIKVAKIENAKYIASPKDMLKKALLLYLNSNCHLKLSTNANLQLGLNITEMSIQPRYAFIQIALELSKDGKVIANRIISTKESFDLDLSDEFDISKSDESRVMSAMNLALEKTLGQIYQTVLEYR